MRLTSEEPLSPVIDSVNPVGPLVKKTGRSRARPVQRYLVFFSVYIAGSIFKISQVRASPSSPKVTLDPTRPPMKAMDKGAW